VTQARSGTDPRIISALRKGCGALRDDDVGSGSESHEAPQISLLGGFGLFNGRVDLTLAEGSQRLLALLALRKRPVKRLLAAGTLWPEVDDVHARSSLRSAVARLDDAAQSALVVTTTHLRLSDEVTVDLWESEALARSLVGPHASIVVRDSTAADLQALSAELLPDWYEDWVLLEAENWRQLRLHALEALARELTEKGRYGNATSAAQIAIQADPLRESARAALIGVHIAEGNISEALREFSKYRETLKRELNIEPTPALKALLVDYLS
jgi:SARP family transcriptional regulator, regulator of embCAB operon